MKRTAAARSRIQQQSSVGVSLFPFLAVLICTMGALILLLVVIARQAQLQAAEDTAVKNAGLKKDLEAECEWIEVEISEYEHSRKQTEAQLAEARLALGHVEDHARRLRQQLAQLEATWAELQGLEAEGSHRRGELDAELRRLRGEIAEAERQLAEARSSAAQRGKSYAVVPYAGPHATHRRPIYIECRSDAIVFQPEGIVLDVSDFAGPLGPGNPLDAALRATREHLLRRQQFDVDEGEPYPLLLVRPDGIEAYYAARAAMKSWASEFGYELIGDDWDLEFRPPDPQLAEELQRVVDAARVRQQRLIAAAPRYYGRRSHPGFVASPYRGGLVPQGGANDDEPGYRWQRSFSRVGGQVAPSGEIDRTASRQDGAVSGGPRRQPAEVARADAVDQRAAETTGRSASNREGSNGARSGQAKSLAATRGRNWGLPNAAVGSVPITSPIRIDCYADRLVLVPEKGLGEPKVVAVGSRTEDAIDEFIAAVWEYMDRWGSAGAGMYWRPVLRVRVAPEAEGRYVDLKTLLEGSGLEVRRHEGS